MSEQKRQAPISRKEEKRKQEEENHNEYDASERDRQIEASNTKATIYQENAIQHVVKGENNTTTTTSTTTTTTANNFHLMTKEEEDLTVKVRNAGDALYYLVLSAIEKAKTISSQKVKE